MKRNSKTIIPYKDIDYELVDLIKCINSVEGIETKNCCCGHGTAPCQIWFKADSIEDVTHFIRNYLYCNPLWRIVFDLTDTEIDDNEWNNPTYLLETTCSDYFYTGVSIDNLTYKMQQKQRELKEDNKQIRCNSCQNNTDELSGECYECVKGIKDNHIAELEKIKEEILNLGFTGWADKPKLYREEVLMILDKHISELSGENKQSRCNNCQNNADELSGECYECVKGIKDNHIAELKGENK